MPKSSKPCCICGCLIWDWPFRIAKRKTCSYKCMGTYNTQSEAYKEAIKRRPNPHLGRSVQCKCLNCGVEFLIAESRNKKGRKYCSRKCWGEHGRIGIKRPNYLRMTTPDGRRIAVHRYLMECILDRRLESHEEVNHINNNRLDNRIENLEVLDKRDHSKISRTQWANNTLVVPIVPKITK